jgi:glycosyltransferase involved in cell wall biosynthesis
MRLLVLGHNDWWVWQQQGFAARTAALVRELAKRPQVELVAVVDTPRWSRRTHRPLEARGDDVTAVAESVVAVRWAYPIPLPANRLRARRLNEALSLGGLRCRTATALCGDGPVIVLVADPRLVGVALRLPHDLLVVDVIDDWRSYPWAGRAAVEEGYGLASLHADVIIGVCEQALRQVGLSDRGRILFNAIDPELWRAARPDAEVEARWRRPVVGYVGVVQHRLDAQLLAAVAQRLPAVDFVVAGPLLYGVPPELAGSSANVHFAGLIENDQLPGWLLAMDACMMPHRHDALTASMDPLKLYEYLAAGRPVVSTLQSPNPVLQALVRVADSADEFAAALEDELRSDSPERQARRRNAVAGQDWPARADFLLTLIDDALHRKAAGAVSRPGGAA